MSISKSFFVTLTLSLLVTVLAAQNTNSTYSRYAYGILENPAMGKLRAMGGIGIGYHEKGLINVLNPASYADVDTMNMLFDMGVSVQLTAFKEGSDRQYNPNSYLDHVGIMFALKPNWGVALGLIPFSKVGYSYSSDFSYEDTPVGDLEYTNTYSGSGGLNTFFLGTGYSPFKGFSVGANLKYTFGVLTNTMTTSYTTSGYNNEQNYYYLFLNIPSIDLGLQYDLKLSKKSMLTIGASVSTSLPQSGELYYVNIASDTTEKTSYLDFSLPNTLGVGFSYNYDNRLTVGLDWQKKQYSQSTFMDVQDSLRDQTRIAFGMEYLPKLITEHYYQAIRYRCGLQVTDQYLKSPGRLRNASLSLGLGLPLRGQKSMLNLGFEVGRLFTPNASFISESYYKLSLDIAFNELWFFKNKL
jgi:hypothetical protein